MDNQNYNLNYENNYNPAPAPAPEVSRKPAITAMVFGIVSLSVSCIPYVGGIIGIIFGILGLVKCGRMQNTPVPQTRGFLKAGKICSIIGIILSGIMLVVYLCVLIGIATYSSSYGYYY